MPSLLRVFTEGWQLKLLAFLLAVLIWVTESAERVTSEWIPIPLEVRVTDPDYTLADASAPDEVEVRFSGSRRELWDLVIRRPALHLSISSIDEVAQTFALDPRMVLYPNPVAVSAQDVRPGAVRLSFVRLARRVLPVRVDLQHAGGQGWTVVDTPSVRPARVEVTGPAERISELSAIPTRPVVLGAGDTSFNRSVALDTARLRGLQLSVPRVQVSGRVDRVMERTYASVPVSVGEGVVIRPNLAHVHVRGPARVVDSMLNGEFRVVIWIDSIPTRIPPEGVQVPLRVEGLRPGVRAVTTPRTVRLSPARTLPDSAEVTRPDEPRDSTGSPPTGRNR